MALKHRYEFEAIGTKWRIDTDAPLLTVERDTVTEYIAQFSGVYSRFDATSLVRQLQRSPNISHEFPDNITPLLHTYHTLYELSSGAINPLVGSSLEQLGYDETYSLQAKTPQPAPELSALQQQEKELCATEPVLLDIGAIGKGLLADEIAEVIGRTHSQYVIDASGDIAVRTAHPQTIGLEHPANPQKIIGTIHLERKSLCASAPNRRKWGNGLHHILDARTGKPAETNIVATWAIAKSTMLADALATGLFFVSPQTLAASFGSFEYVIMKENGRIEHNIQQIGELYT